MKHNVAPSLHHLLVPVEELTHLEVNPRTSDTKAIAASYEEFGQLNAIVCSLEDDDSILVLAGNHQLMAARDELGWTHIAAAVHEHLTDEQKMAFAALDNHWADVGSIDADLQYRLLEEAGDINPELFELVGWDDFELAAMEQAAVLHEIAEDRVDSNAGWVAPTIVAPLVNPDPENKFADPNATPEERAETFTPEADSDTIVTQGSTVTSKAGSQRALIQYTLTFDEPEQQSAWYEFLRFLKSDPAYKDLGSTAAQAIAFIQKHVAARA